MSKDGLAAVLHALATDTKGRPETARLRDVFDDVEIALGAGVTHAAVLQALHDQGFRMGMASFRSALYRIRKERADQQPAPARTTTAIPAPATPTVEAPAPAEPDTPQQEATEDIPPDLVGLPQVARDKAMRERKAQQFISDKPKNPLLKSLQQTKEKQK